MTKIEPDEGSTLILGRGLNSITLDELALGIDTVTKISSPHGQNVTYEFREIEDISRLREALSISASASFAAGVGAVSGKASYLHSVSFSSYAIYTFIRVKVTNATTVLHDYKLTEETVNYLKEYGETSFFENFGDEFVASTTSGGEFLAVLEISFDTKEEKEKTSAEMSGSYGFFNAAIDFQKSLEKFNFHSSTSLYISRRGGKGEMPDIKDIKSAALKFPTEVTGTEGNSVMIQVMTLPYAVTTNRPNNMRLINLEKQRDALGRLILLREKAALRLSNLLYASERPFLFSEPDVTVINQAIATCRSQIRQIEDVALQCRDSMGRTIVEPTVEVPNPNLNWSIPFEPGLQVMAHVESISNMYGEARKYVGTKDQNLRCEGIAMSIAPPIPGLYIEYMVHGQEYADSGWTRDGNYAGTQGRNLRIEGFAVRLIGPLAPYYDVLYEAHVEGMGNIPGQNGSYVGTKGEARRCEGLRIWVTRRL